VGALDGEASAHLKPVFTSSPDSRRATAFGCDVRSRLLLRAAASAFSGDARQPWRWAPLGGIERDTHAQRTEAFASR